MSTYTEKQSRSIDKRSNGSDAKTANVFTRAERLAEEATDYIAELPKAVKEEIKTRPYRTLGIAAAIGVGAGIILNSRILRATVASLASVIVAEVGRSYLKTLVAQEFSSISFDNKDEKKAGEAKVAS